VSEGRRWPRAAKAATLQLGPKPSRQKSSCAFCGKTDYYELIKCKYCPQAFCEDCYPPMEHGCMSVPSVQQCFSPPFRALLSEQLSSRSLLSSPVAYKG